MPKSKILMTCRETIFRNEALLNTFLSTQKNIVQLHSNENALTFEDKYDLLEKYKIDANLLTQNCMSLASNMFPFLCKVFSEMNKITNYGSDFFISPVSCLLTLLDEMKTRNKIQYATLVLLLTNQNKLSEDLDVKTHADNKFKENKYEILERCKLSRMTGDHEFIDALKEMDGTYTQHLGRQFTFIHDSMIEITAYHFGCQFPEMIIQYMSSDYIVNYIKLETHDIEERTPENTEKETCNNEHRSTYCQLENVLDLRIILKDTYYPHLATRLLKDVEDGELYNVFTNESLKHTSVIRAFIEELTKKTYEELYACFFFRVERCVQNKPK